LPIISKEITRAGDESGSVKTVVSGRAAHSGEAGNMQEMPKRMLKIAATLVVHSI